MALVLIVDDHVDTCRIVQKLIRRLGPEAECVHSGAAALAFVGRREPSLVLLDVSMPGMDGLETLERIKADRGLAHVPVVMFTAAEHDATRRRALELGAADYWRKGTFDWSRLATSLARYVPLGSGGADGRAAGPADGG